jgi:hypothetical protein
MRCALVSDSWLRATFVLAVVQGLFLAIVQARPGLFAVVLWFVMPPLVVLAAAALLTVALVRSWRRREISSRSRVAGMALLAVVIGSIAVFRAYPSAYDAKPSRVPFRLPLEGPVTVAWGGPTLAVNYHAVMPDQRWSFDLVVTANGHTFRGDGSRLEDYYAFDRPVLAPAAGVVRIARDCEPDGPIRQWRVRRAAGNYVVLEVADGEFLFIAHLRHGSITVAAADRVREGQVIGRVGNSGNSSEPHVHLHLQDTPRTSLGEGIPFYFHGYRVRGVETARGMPVGGREGGRWPGAFTGDVVEHIDSQRR